MLIKWLRKLKFQMPIKNCYLPELPYFTFLTDSLFNPWLASHTKQPSGTITRTKEI